MTLMTILSMVSAVLLTAFTVCGDTLEERSVTGVLSVIVWIYVVGKLAEVS